MMPYSVRLIDRKAAETIIKKWHYSKSINGVISDYCFGLFDDSDDEVLIGAMIFGRLAMANQYKKYTDNVNKIIELRRLACIDNTIRNTESFFISRALRWLQQNTNIQLVLSYADANYGHIGTIYKASNFEYLGTTAKTKIILWKNKKYHDKAIRTKYKGKLKPFAIRLKEAIDNKEAVYKQQVGKHIYLYKFKPVKKRQSLSNKITVKSVINSESMLI